MKNRTLLAVCALAAALSLAACSGTSPRTATPSPTSAPSTQTPQATVTTGPVEQTPTPTAGEPLTCENMISAATVDALTSQGWTFQQQELRIGETPVDGGLLCSWADYTTASDHGQMYGWAPISEQLARTAESGLERDGWLRSSADGRTYLTEDPAYAIAQDDEGFGMTYEFGDGWVKFADTKQGLLLIERDE
ncbi:MAG: hypothetical protein WBA87_07890 [Microbacterium sp.]